MTQSMVVMPAWVMKDNAENARRESMKHEKVLMTFLAENPSKSRPTRTFKHGKNIWSKVYRCDLCGALVSHLSNLHRPKPTCDGTRKPKDSLTAQQWDLHRKDLGLPPRFADEFNVALRHK